MPEVSEGMDQTSSGNAVSGFWIWRPAYPTGLRRSRLSHLQNFVTPTDNKENIPPTSARRSVRQRKSPLPYWYPRTPLRDITVVVNALERRRLRARATNVQQRNSNLEELSMGSPVVDDELNAYEHTPISQILPSGGSNTSSSPADTDLSDVLSSEVSDTSPSVVNTSNTQVLHSDVSDTSPSHADRVYTSATPIGQAVITPSSNTATTEHALCSESAEDPKTVEYEKKLQTIIEELELVVKENLKRTPSRPVQKSTRILMSMR
ncbi:uncharacterized protein LOC121988399 [Zingiber officinale]|uniref:Uncharacterized protein n=1 Tax=Zingiber officinale TaxID=94328 RepID=A0A8J5G6L0_ZINOF|nr:uncharacterized protein LOC121988399 [Zingiber officinale]XP_042397728.1 uncharacterized protein LOC121988399 [Zingiber officinale]XP_042397729.1 uncharacterized protein LOC121988399 [Zingiber officinale]XP_042397730.1 uncharacterized protein LOC121988399 [Zingiber officinale]XP_042397731.1 uncharacterized protein LOC121988399 [Zingiber officinale]XP_042397732.1 uncharacterized protein LOC121988399 [Zingiber officinale]XP_042397733.1 uncharacterized protein LOC121988399 [Zingiber officinal